MKGSTGRGYGRRYRRRLLAAAFLGNVLPLAVATAGDFGSHPPVFFAGAVGACLAAMTVVLVPRRHRVTFYLGAYGGLPCLALLQAESGGPASGYSVLLMMPMIWFGLQASDRELIAAGAVLAACSFLPMLVVGPPAYPVDWAHATLLVIVGCAVAGSLRTLSREMEQLTGRLRREAVADNLTGLLNRRGWDESARRELARADRAHLPAVLVTIDLDDLKGINDVYGHEEGDRALRETAERLRLVLRESDVVARLGGDEFAALLCEARLDDALTIVERLREVTPQRGRFSAGVATWRGGTEQLGDLLRRADLALYSAKAGGGGRSEIAPRSLGARDLETSAGPG
jgi:diguanylate cyclase (GGDEF)-like protein